MMVELKPRELKGHRNAKTTAILIQAPKGEGAETIGKPSTSKRMEARGLSKKDLTIFDNDEIVRTVKKFTAECKMKCKVCQIEKPLDEFPVCAKKKNGENYNDFRSPLL